MSDQVEHSSREITEAENVLAAYTMLQRPPYAQLVFAAWGDGTLVWSGDRRFGGPPYRTAAVGAARVHSILGRLKEDGLFASLPIYSGGPVGVDWTDVYVRRDGETFEMSSFHELDEYYAELFGTTPLDDRLRFEVLSRESQEHLFSRLVWTELRRAMEKLVPDSESPCFGRLEGRHGVLRWLTDKEGRTKA